MKLIPLTKGKFAKVDDADFDLYTKYSWHFSSGGYAVRSQWLYRTDRRQKNIPMHRQLLGVDNPNVLIDHIDGDKLNNQRHNLRESTKSTNGCNRGKTKRNTSGFKGVTKHTQCKDRWMAQIRANNKHYYLGLFPTPIEAAQAYDKAALHHFGEFALINGV